MALAEQIQSDLTTAMKARDTQTVATLRLVLAAVKNLRVAAGHTGEVTDEETVELLARQAKQRREAAEAYDGAGRPELAERERGELVIVERYLPQQLDDVALDAVVDEVVAAAGASGPSELGKVMSAVMPRVKGRADGKRVNAAVRRRLTPG